MLTTKENIIYDVIKKKGNSQVTSGIRVPSVLNKSPFAPSVPQEEDVVNGNSDSEYMDAVNKGDMETAQIMATEAAKKAGYDAEMFHETDAENIHIFDISRGDHDGRDYQTPYGIFTKTSAKNIGLGSKQMRLFVKAHNTLRVKNREDVMNKIPGFVKFYDQIQAIDKKYDAIANKLEDEELDAFYEWAEEHPDADMDAIYPNEYIIEGKPADIDDPKYLAAHERYQQNMAERESAYNAVAVKAKAYITDYLRSNDYDSMYFVVDGGSFGRQTDSLIVLDENQVKSADPVTYDDNGDVIPLSERFNQANKDIRYKMPKPTNDGYDTTHLAWAIEAGIINESDQARFWEAVAEIRKLNYNSFARTKNGGYIIETKDAMMFTDGDFKSPTLSKVIVFTLDGGKEVDETRRMIRDEAKRTGRTNESVSFAEDLYGSWFVAEYNARDYQAYAWKIGRGEGTHSEGASAEGESRGVRYGGENGVRKRPGLNDKPPSSPSVSSRELLADAFDELVQTPKERELMGQFRANITKVEEVQDRLQKVRGKIRELTKAKGDNPQCHL